MQVIRYYPYYGMALELMKRLMCEQSNLDDEAKDTVMKSSSGLAELHSAVGHDHYVVTPCVRASLGDSSGRRKMEGSVRESFFVWGRHSSGTQNRTVESACHAVSGVGIAGATLAVGMTAQGAIRIVRVQLGRIWSQE